MNGFTIWQRAVAVWTAAGDRNIGLIAAGVAFFGMFGVFPGIAAVIAVFGLVADPVIVADQLALMEDVIPEDAYAILQSQVQLVLGAQTGTLGWATVLSLALAIWSARAAVAALLGGINAIEGTPPRSGLWQAIVALVLTVALVSLAVVALATIVILPVVIAYAPIEIATARILELSRWAIALAVLLIGLGLLYRFGPNLRGLRRPWLSIGSVLVVFLWIGASVGLSYYLGQFADYQAVYGSIGAVIGMLLWMYVSAYLILLGAVLNAQVYPSA